MKIAFITTKSLRTKNGASNRSRNFFQAIKNTGNTIKVFSFLDQQEVNKYNNTKEYYIRLNSIYQKIVYTLQGEIPYIKRLKNYHLCQDDINDILNSDVIHFEEHDSFYVLEKYLNYYKGKIVLNAHNIDYEKFYSEVNTKSLPFKIFGLLLTLKVKKYEISIIKRISNIIVCSKRDRDIYLRMFKNIKIHVIPNGVDINNNNNKLEINKNILFIGNLNYPPNHDGLKYYIEKVHPLVLKFSPDTELRIVGSNPPKWLIKISAINNSIKLCGYIDNLSVLIKQINVCICPIRYGSGTRIKILEYMAMKKPVVSTIKGAEGLDLSNSENIFLTDNNIDFSNKVVLLLNNTKLNRMIGENGYKLVKKKYNWNKIQKNIQNYYNTELL